MNKIADLIHSFKSFCLYEKLVIRKHPTPMTITTPSPVFTGDTEYLKELDFSIFTDKSLKLFTTQELT